ncbi:hypothetical protein CIW83_07370 [Tissierella sp. P1]|uniref:hypothetical protein n=1 Tax=Tissierella sp. P1 TaxID=1280483 RepID=UPI000BA09CD0|nr:hypothetical protein [Tissierella sp. P1]OZV12711.1 hypothetical protein CIW83_07370 [Tissierella sp. P1]
MKVIRILSLFLLLILLIPNLSYGIEDNPRVYLIVINKLTLKDIEFMENLKKIIEGGSIGLMNTRGVSGYTGAESFLTINSSRKSSCNYASIDFLPRELNGSIVNKSFSRLIKLNKNNKFSPYIGAIGDNLHSVGLKTAIYGNGDLINMPLKTAALIPMDSRGLVDYGNIDNITIEDNDYPFTIKTDYKKLLSEIKNSSANLIVGDTGDLDRIYRYSDFLSEDESKNIRERILLDIDSFIGELITILKYDKSLLIITSPNSGDINVDDNKLSPIITWGNGIGKGILTSATTERAGIVANIDIGPTIMSFLKAPMDNMSGSQIKSIRKNDINLKDIIEYSQQINTTSKVRYNTLYYYGIFSMIILSLAIIFLIAKIRLSGKTKDITKVLFAMILVFPNIFILVSIFKPRRIYSFILILFTLMLLSLIVLWVTRKSSNQIINIVSISIVIIILDLTSRGSISKFSVLSHDPTIGARYYGIGNEMVGLFLGSITIFSIGISKRNDKSLIPLFLLGISIILVGHPHYGANVGGTMAFIVATVFYVVEIFNKDKVLNLKRVFFMVISIILLISIMGFIDIKFNRNTTHLGNTILLTKNNGLSYLNKIIFRKLLMNIKLIGNSFWTYILLLHMILHTSIFYFKKKNNKILTAAIAGLSGAIGGFLLNDSGLILAAICMNLITAGLYLEFVE